MVCARVIPLSSLTLQLRSGWHIPPTCATPSVLHGVFWRAQMSCLWSHETHNILLWKLGMLIVNKKLENGVHMTSGSFLIPTKWTVSIKCIHLMHISYMFRCLCTIIRDSTYAIFLKNQLLLWHCYLWVQFCSLYVMDINTSILQMYYWVVSGGQTDRWLDGQTYMTKLYLLFAVLWTLYNLSLHCSTKWKIYLVAFLGYHMLMNMPHTMNIFSF